MSGAQKELSPVVAELIERLRLEPHPEGGFYRETWRSPVTLEASSLPAGYSAARSAVNVDLFFCFRLAYVPHCTGFVPRNYGCITKAMMSCSASVQQKLKQRQNPGDDLGAGPFGAASGGRAAHGLAACRSASGPFGLCACGMCRCAGVRFRRF